MRGGAGREGEWSGGAQGAGCWGGAWRGGADAEGRGVEAHSGPRAAPPRGGQEGVPGGTGSRKEPVKEFICRLRPSLLSSGGRSLWERVGWGGR